MGHSQLSFIVPNKELYHLNYPYRPGITEEIVDHHKDQSKINISKFKTKSTTFPKLQEVESTILIQCIKNFYLGKKINYSSG